MTVLTRDMLVGKHEGEAGEAPRKDGLPSARSHPPEPLAPSAGWTADAVVQLLNDIRALNAGEFWAKYPGYSPGEPLIDYAINSAKQVRPDPVRDASPDLYAALEGMLRATADDAADAPGWTARKLAKAALAKARGEQ